VQHRFLWLVLIAAGLASAQPQPIPMSGPPKIGVIDVYGQRRIPADRVVKALGIKVGDPLPASKVDLEDKLEAVSGIVRSHTEAVCCAANGAVLYLGIEERGVPHFQFRLPAAGVELPLPAKDDLPGLRKAVREADSASVRADTALLLGELLGTAEIVDDLQFAAQDADPVVRQAAVRSLVRHSINPLVKIEPTWMIEMLNSVVLTDRKIAVEALMELTERPDPLLLGKIRERGFESLVQMAQFQHLPDALPSYLLLCRVGGVSKQEAEASWTAGQRAVTILRILKPKKK
jgi:hypothetical protein